MCRWEYADNSYGEFVRDENPVAAWAHVCGDCGRQIRMGERYRRITGKWDGRFDTYKMCAHCEAAAQWLVAVCNGFLFGEVREELEEHWYDEPRFRSVGLARLIVGMKLRWHDGRDPVPVGVAAMARGMQLDLG